MHRKGWGHLAPQWSPFNWAEAHVMWWAQNPDQIRTQRVENILEELGSEEQLQGEKIAKGIWSGRRWDSCFPDLIGYNMVCPDLGKKELGDRKGKVDVAGKRGGIWRVKKGGQGLKWREGEPLGGRSQQEISESFPVWLYVTQQGILTTVLPSVLRVCPPRGDGLPGSHLPFHCC